MAEYVARVVWALAPATAGEHFLAGKYSREHTWSFDGGLTVPASPSPHVVRVPYANPACVDPEEAFVASISSCHMLTFLYLASRDGIAVLRYEDDAVGTMSKNERRVSWVSAVVLHPRVTYRSDTVPSPGQEADLHHRAHRECFIANSVKTAITVAGLSAPDGAHG